MGKFELKIEKLAQKHLEQHFKIGNKATIEKIFIELSEHPYYWRRQTRSIKI